MTPWEHVVEQASAKKPLGQLQRGSGAGALWALDAPARKSHHVVLQAMAWDTRWDRIMEQRPLYFARLATDLQLDLEPLFRHIRDNDRGVDPGERFGRKTGLVHMSPVIELPIGIISVLMARASDHQARRFAGRYVAEGLCWQSLLERAAELGGAQAVEGLDEVLASRFSESERPSAFSACDPRGEPWKSWGVEGVSPLQPIIDARRHEQERYLADWRASHDVRVRDYRSKSTQELLDSAETEYRQLGFSDELAQRRSEGDIAVLVAAIRPENGKKAAAAIRALGDQLDPRMIEPTVRAIEANPEENSICIEAAPFLTRFPAELVLPHARRWLASGKGFVWHCARGVLSRHATKDDIPLVVALLRKKVTPNNMHVIADALHIACRFKGHGSFKEIRRLFKEAPSSWARSFAAYALAATEPDFATKYAPECLWDCQSDTRALGVETVSLTDNRAGDRVRMLAHDPLESEATRSAAMKRLGAPS